MANQLYAVTTIRHGDGDKEKVFEPGDLVTGFDEAKLERWRGNGVVATKSRLRILRPELFDDDSDEGPSDEELAALLESKGYKIQAPAPEPQGGGSEPKGDKPPADEKKS